MNYRHAYHAGNFADVLKHTVLARVIDYLKRKDAPFRVIDAHAGAGRYALSSPMAAKTGEWQGGIGRLIGPGAQPFPSSPARYLQPYLEVVRGANPGGGLAVYPGSPCIALALMRRDDTLIANELHPEERISLEAAVGRDRRAKVMALDAWVALKALLPPKERRGIVLIDPPFEEKGDLDRMIAGLEQGLERFATGTYLCWYPIKDLKPIAQFHAALAGLGLPKLLRVDLMIEPPDDPGRLNGCGLVVANPPYTLQGELEILLPHLARRLAGSRGGASHRLEWLDNARKGASKARPGGKRRVRTTR